MVQLALWQLCFLIRNIYFDPSAAYPLYYFLNSGYTVFSYLALVMFSYYFVTPVFKRESQIVLFSGLTLSAVIFIYSIFFVFPGGINTAFNPVLHVYEAEPAEHRIIILFILAAFIIITTKNLIYKIISFKGEQRDFVLNMTLALITGVSAVVGVALAQYYIDINPNIHNTINTYISGILFIYFYLTYLSLSKIHFLYSDKTMLLILFIIIIISSMITSITFVNYERVYFKNMQNTLDRVAAETLFYSDDIDTLQKKLKLLYDNEFEYILLQEPDSGDKTFLLGKPYKFTETLPADGENLTDTGNRIIHTENEKIIYFFKTKAGDDILYAGIPYLDYRKHLDSFVKAAFFTVLAVMAILFLFMRFVIFLGLTRPLKQLYTGVKEIHDGNLDHRIEESAQDEIGFISRKFNQMVDNLRISGDLIRRSEEKFRELTGMLPDIVYETDLNMNVTYLNQAGFEITGFTENDLQQGLSLQQIVNRDEFTRLYRMLSKVDDKNEKSGNIATHQIITKTGEILLAENNAAVIYYDRTPVGIRGVIRDVTEKTHTENALIQAQKMETIGTLTGGIAHDFNNVLTGITGTVSLMDFKIRQKGSITAEEIKNDLNTLQKSADRAGDMVKQLLALSRRQKPILQKIDLNPVAEEVHEVCRNSFDKKINLDFRYQDGGAFAMAEETQIGQILLNLCVNARDAMTIMRQDGEEHSGTLSLSLKTITPGKSALSKIPGMSEGTYCRIRVSDTGVGMDSETMARIFDPFFSTKGKENGTGLGLAMVYNIVKLHNGFIYIDSKKSYGTTIDIYIPAADSPSFSELPEEPGREPSNYSAVILLVDDDPIIQKTCEKLLNALGCTVIKAVNGREGVEIYRSRKNEIDAVILDVEMPVMSGDEAFSELKKIDPEIRVLVSSGFREDPRIDHIMENGADGFIRKPYTLETLSKEISAILKNY